MDLTTGLAIFGAAVTSAGGLVWSVRQEGRINAHDQLFVEREKLASERHGEVMKKLDQLAKKLDNGGSSAKY